MFMFIVILVKKVNINMMGVNYIFEYEPFYVGCGKGYRWKRHINQSSLNKKYNTIKNGKLKHIIENGYNPLEYVIFYKTNLSKTESLSIEKEIIRNIGRIGNENGILSNMNDGGADTICGFSLSSKGKSYDEIYGKRKSQFFLCVVIPTVYCCSTHCILYFKTNFHNSTN